MPKYILLDKQGKIRVVMAPLRMHGESYIEQVLEYDTYEAALTVAKEHGNLDVAEVHVITRVRTTMHEHQTIDYCLEDTPK